MSIEVSALSCLRVELEECVQPGVTVCRVSVKGRVLSLLLFLMGNSDGLRKSLFPEEGKGHLCTELFVYYCKEEEESVCRLEEDLWMFILDLWQQ